MERRPGRSEKLRRRGKVIAVRGITVFRIENGRIKTERTEYDRLGMMRQIGVVAGAGDDVPGRAKAQRLH